MKVKVSAEQRRTPGIFIPQKGISGLFCGMLPDAIENLSEVWAKDISRHGPWSFLPPVLIEYSAFPGCMPISLKELPVWQAVGTGNTSCRIIVCRNAESTMDAASGLFKQGDLSCGDSVVAISQCKGRGQHGRTWYSEPGNLYATWIIAEKNGWNHIVPLFAGYVAASVLRGSGIEVMLKWPNDLVVSGKKIGGILTESRHGIHRIGIGINIEHAPEQALLRDEFAFPATSLKHCGINTGPLSLWEKIVETGNKLWEQWTAAFRPQDIVCLVERYMSYIGEKITIRTTGNRTISGLLTGLAQDGGLKLREKEGIRIIYNGSIVPE